MGTQLSFTDENVKKSPFDYPKLKLANGESARLTIVENPYSEYVHRIQKPVLDDRNEVVFVTKEKKDGTEYRVPKLSWVSSPICLGDKAVLESEGIDPENCPICERAAAGEKGFYPQRRFAMHVIKSNTKPKSFEASEPWGGQLLIWAFTDQIFSKLVEFQKEHGLADNDLKLGPCTDETFQKADLNIAKGTVVSDANRKAYFAEKNRAEDPTVFCGSRKTKERILEDLKQVDAAWAKSRGESQDEAVISTAGLSEGLDALLSDEPAEKKESAKSSAPEPVASFDDLPVSEEKEEAPAATSAPDSIDSLLDSLG